MPRACDRIAPHPPDWPTAWCPCMTSTGGRKRPWPRGAPARILARGERTATPPVLCLARTYEEAHPRPDLDEFIRQYRKAGGQIEVTVFEGEGEGLLRNLSSSVARQALEKMTTFIHRHLG